MPVLAASLETEKLRTSALRSLRVFSLIPYFYRIDINYLLILVKDNLFALLALIVCLLHSSLEEHVENIQFFRHYCWEGGGRDEMCKRWLKC